MNNLYQLVEHKGGGLAARFYVDGVRVTREHAENLKNRAYSTGRLSCFHTTGKQMPGGRTRRTNYTTVQF